MWNTLLFENQDGIGILKINRPKALNALNDEVMTDLQDWTAKVAADKSVKVIIITGEGEKSFVAGADIGQMQALDAPAGAAWGRLGQSVMTAIENLPQPVIAAINGFALGGGNELAISCDMRIASEKAKFGQPEVGLGITPGFGGTQRLPRLIGPGRARYLLYTAEIIDAQKALEFGLVDMVVAPEALMETALGVAKKIAKQRTFAVQQTKQCALRGVEAPLTTALEFEAQAFGLCFATADQKEAMQKFLDKSKK
ncbi:MAG: enoyl-CoA hydratase-related protein [Bilophila sp.]